jgi:hypothetical protein
LLIFRGQDLGGDMERGDVYDRILMFGGHEFLTS